MQPLHKLPATTPSQIHARQRSQEILPEKPSKKSECHCWPFSKKKKPIQKVTDIEVREKSASVSRAVFNKEHHSIVNSHVSVSDKKIPSAKSTKDDEKLE